MLQVRVVNRKATKQVEQLRSEGWAIADVTSKSPDLDHRKFSPFYPIGGLRVPGQPAGSRMAVSESVEGAWQGLKVFEREGADASKMGVKTLKALKRSSRAKNRGSIKGHAFEGRILSDYIEARKRIYVPLYEQALTRLAHQLQGLRDLARAHGDRIALLDYETNTDIEDPRKPLSHASLVANALRNMMQQ